MDGLRNASPTVIPAAGHKNIAATLRTPRRCRRKPSTSPPSGPFDYSE